MRTTTTKLPLAVCAAMIVGLLAACSGESGETADLASAPASAAPASEEEVAPVAITVSIDAGLEEGAKAAFDERVAQFEEAHPDIDVTPQEYTWTATTFTAELAGGTLPDVFTIPFTDGRGLIAAGQIADISALVQELPYADDFNPNVAAAGEDAEGNMLAVPIAAYGQGLHYNRALFTEAGLDPDDPPATWEEVREAARQISEKTGQTGFAEMTQDNTGGWILTTLAYTLGGRMIEVDGDDTAATLDTQEVAEALQMLHTMRWEDDSMGANFLYDWGTINQEFAAGKVGMYVSGGGNYGSLITQNAMNPDDYGVTVLPLAEDSEAGVLGGGTLAAVSVKATPEQQDAAVQWIDFFYMEKLAEQDAAVADARTLFESDQPVGAPQLPVFDAATYEQSLEWVAETSTSRSNRWSPTPRTSLISS